MRKLQKAAVIAAVMSGVAVFGAGSASAMDSKPAKPSKPSVMITQANACKSHDVNLSVLNNVGVLNGLGGNLLGGEGDPGAQFYEQGSTVACSNAIG